MEGRESRGGRDAGQDKRINTEGSKQEECWDDNKNRNRRQEKLKARFMSRCTITMLCCRGNKLFFLIPPPKKKRGRKVNLLVKPAVLVKLLLFLCKQQRVCSGGVFLMGPLFGFHLQICRLITIFSQMILHAFDAFIMLIKKRCNVCARSLDTSAPVVSGRG